MNVFHEDRMVGHQVDPEDIAVREVYGTIAEEHR